MDVYKLLAEDFIKLVKSGERYYVFFKSPSKRDFGFEHMQGYSGLMAQPRKTGKNAGIVKKQKQGLFDIRLITGDRYDGKVTHRALIIDLLKHSSLDNCFEAWKGGDPREIGANDDEKEALTTMVLMMFEQELNWGNETWQRGTYFPPYQTRPCQRRPRDMIMGFVHQAFDLGIDNLDKMKYWMKIKPGTLCFNNPDGNNQFFRQYPPEYKKYFDRLEGVEGAEALMVGEFRDRFRELAEAFPDNPLYK